MKDIEHIKNKFRFFWSNFYDWPEDLIEESLENHDCKSYETRLVGMGVGITKELLMSEDYNLNQKIIISCLIQNSIIDDDGLLISLEKAKTISTFLNLPYQLVREEIAFLCEKEILCIIDGGAIIFLKEGV